MVWSVLHNLPQFLVQIDPMQRARRNAEHKIRCLIGGGGLRIGNMPLSLCFKKNVVMREKPLVCFPGRGQRAKISKQNKKLWIIDLTHKGIKRKTCCRNFLVHICINVSMQQLFSISTEFYYASTIQLWIWTYLGVKGLDWPQWTHDTRLVYLEFICACRQTQVSTTHQKVT